MANYPMTQDAKDIRACLHPNIGIGTRMMAIQLNWMRRVIWPDVERAGKAVRTLGAHGFAESMVDPLNKAKKQWTCTQLEGIEDVKIHEASPSRK